MCPLFKMDFFTEISLAARNTSGGTRRYEEILFFRKCSLSSLGSHAKILSWTKVGTTRTTIFIAHVVLLQPKKCNEKRDL